MEGRSFLTINGRGDVEEVLPEKQPNSAEIAFLGEVRKATVYTMQALTFLLRDWRKIPPEEQHPEVIREMLQTLKTFGDNDREVSRVIESAYLAWAAGEDKSDSTGNQQPVFGFEAELGRQQGGQGQANPTQTSNTSKPILSQPL